MREQFDLNKIFTKWSSWKSCQ